MNMNKRIVVIGQALVPVLLLMLLVLLKPFYSLDALMCDSVYQQLDGVSRDIIIIAVDEETLEAYGNFQMWSRYQTTELIKQLSADKTMAPAVIGLDFIFDGETDPAIDTALAEACAAAPCPVVFASNVVYRGATKEDEQGKLYYDNMNVEWVEKPYSALNEVVQNGFANTYLAKDGCVRYTRLTEQYQLESINSFASLIYQIFEEGRGNISKLPETEDSGVLEFFYSGKVGEFSHVSMKSVLEGNVPASEFQNRIVLVGSYAAGFQDAYGVPVERNKSMHGVEIHANIIQALMEEKTAVALPQWIYLIGAGSVIFLFVIFAKGKKLIPVLVMTAVLMFAHLKAGQLLAEDGYTIQQLPFQLLLLLLGISFILKESVIEKIRRRKMLSTFKKYVAPQVVDQLARDDSFTVKLGGEKRNVAVLFVDIRGFTPLSESLQPEQVVSILNEYLALTTSCIQEQKGMLDKFIGDATMAVFNAPFDLDDYIFRAVKAAVSMRNGADEMAEKLFARFNRKVNFGIGINCGEAVVGNIGCQFRMDYTAIGDTVNTAARLESRAGAGEILISQAVYDKLADRIIAELVGEMSLKGKSETVTTYRVIALKE